MAFRDSINDLMFRFYERFKQNNNRLPVSVDADINVGDVQIGTVKQGGVDEGAEPWKVKAEELEQKIDALKQSIESGVQLKGQIEASGAHIAPILGPRIKWQAKLDAVPERMVLGRDGYIYTTRTGSVRKIDPVTGGVVWEHVGIASPNMRTIVADANGNVYVDSSGTLQVLDKYGEVIASRSFGIASISGMDIDDDHLYLWLSNIAIVKVPLSDITTEVWRLDSSDGITNYCSAMVVGDEYLYAADNQRWYYKIDKDDGTIEWTHQESLPKPVFGLALDSDGYLYSGGRYTNTQGNHLIKFDPSGASGPIVVWDEVQQESIIRSVAVYRDVLYTVNDAGDLGLRDLDGNVVWRVPITDHRINGVTVDHASVYCNTNVDAYIIALDKELQLTGYREVG